MTDERQQQVSRSQGDVRNYDRDDDAAVPEYVDSDDGSALGVLAA